MITQERTLSTYFQELVFAPVDHPEIIPSVLPLILGIVVLELYFGKHKQEVLGWNSSVANAIIWLSTGIALILSGDIETGLERSAAYFLIAIGGFTAYMNFYHKWKAGIAFIVSSSAVVYSLAYVTVVLIKTGMEINPDSIKASVAFIVAVGLIFRVIQSMEKPAADSFQLR